MTEGWREGGRAFGRAAGAGRPGAGAGGRRGRFVIARPSGRSNRVACAAALLLAMLTLSALTPYRLAAQSLERRIDARLEAAPWNRNLWGLAVVDDRGRVVYEQNADKLFVPASNTKLVVSAVAAALLPGDFTVKTSVYPAGEVTDGVLKGDLVLYGRGDPTFSLRCYAVDTLATGVCDRDSARKFRELAAELQARGVRTVEGDVVGDGSYFESDSLHPAWDIYDINWWYAAPVAALGFNDNSVDITWRPGAAVGAPAELSVSPDFGNVVLDNRTVTVDVGGEADIGDRMWRVAGTDRILVEGTVPVGHRGGTDNFAVDDPNLFAARALRAALAESGISVTGATRSTTDSLLYRTARAQPALAEVESRPLRDWIFPILNTSQNWFAEMTLKQLGRQFGKSGSWDEGLEVERRFLIDSVGIDSTAFKLSDGSGLSSNNLISPRAFTQLLRYMRTHSGWDTFSAGLPRSAATGSLRRRFTGTALEGRVVAKTGSISGVNTLAGYIERRDGKVWTFSVQANNHAQRGSDVIRGIDSLVVEMGR